MTHHLQTLHNKVEAGEVLQAYEASDIWPTYYDKETGRNVLIWLDACKASRGYLDAAKALHDAVLPGWGVNLCFWTDSREWQIALHSPDGQHGVEASTQDKPSRAWLLSILKALISEAHNDT